MDAILLLLGFDVVALLLVGAFAAFVPPAWCGLLATASCGLGILLCMPAMLLPLPAATLNLQVGPPGLSLHFALDSLATCFLVVVFLTGAAVVAARTGAAVVAALTRTSALASQTSIGLPIRAIAGAAVAILASDGVALALGLALCLGSIWRPWSGERTTPPSLRAALLAPLLVLMAVCLLTPAGFAPRFDIIRTSPVDLSHATAAAILAVAAAVTLFAGRSPRDDWTQDALTAAVLLPAASYLLLRMLADLPGPAASSWDLALLPAGGAIAVAEAWRSATHPDIGGIVASLARRQFGLVMMGVGLAIIAGAADLHGSASAAVAATLLSAIGGSVSGVLITIAAQSFALSAGSVRLSRLGGLIHTMPVTCGAMAVGLLGHAMVPPGTSFAATWLLFDAIRSAPRGNGGWLLHFPLALSGVAIAVSAAAMALSAALATAACVRLAGIAMLGRPRTPRGSSAPESPPTVRAVLIGLSGLSALIGSLPGAALWLLANPAIDGFTAGSPNARIGPAVFWDRPAASGYLAPVMLVMIAVTTACVLSLRRRPQQEAKPAGVWADGTPPPIGLPFGEPAAQSTGAGFVPALPDLPALRWPRLPAVRPPPAATMLWLLLAAFGGVLLASVVAG